MKRIVMWLSLLLLTAACALDGDGPAQSATPAPTRTPTPEIGVTLVTRAPPTVAVIQTTPTPLPTATALPSPTPIHYVVEEGDTLLGIAIENLTSVDEIAALNPGVIAELLQIGQTLALPPPATPVFSGEASTPVPLHVGVQNIQLARTPVGSMWILGEVTNHGDFAVGGIQVQIDLAGADGDSLLSVPAWVASGILRAGERGPFAVLVREPPAEQVQPVVAIVAGDTLVEQGTHYLDLAVRDTEANIEDSQANVAGAIENVGQETATTLTVVATFYDAQGNVTGYAQQILREPLAPGERASYGAGGAPPGGATVDYAVTVYGLTE